MAKFTAESVVDHAPVALFLETGKWIRIDGWNWDFDGIAPPPPPPHPRAAARRECGIETRQICTR